MRRKDREVTDPQKIRQMIERCHCCRLGLCDQGKAYIVPLSFGYEERDGRYFFYFHGAKEGRKLDLMRENPYVGFELDTGYELTKGDSACQYGARFQSAIGEGKVTFLEKPEEKKEALQLLMKHYTGCAEWEMPDKALEAVCVFQMEALEMTCKEHE